MSEETKGSTESFETKMFSIDSSVSVVPTITNSLSTDIPEPITVESLHTQHVSHVSHVPLTRANLMPRFLRIHTNIHEKPIIPYSNSNMKPAQDFIPHPLSNENCANTTIKVFNHTTEKNKCMISIACNVNNDVQLRLPLDIIILLDVSGSMAPHFKSIVQKIHDFVMLLTEYDRFTVITFSSQTEQLLPLLPMTPENKIQYLTTFNRTDKWHSYTNLKSGIEHLIDVVNNAYHPNRSTQVVLITDGIADKNCEGKDEFAALFKLPNISAKMCTFGGEIKAKTLLDVLGKRMHDYVHLDNASDLYNLLTQIKTLRRNVIFDDITCSVDGKYEHTECLPQLGTNEEVTCVTKHFDQLCSVEVYLNSDTDKKEFEHNEFFDNGSNTLKFYARGNTSLCPNTISVENICSAEGDVIIEKALVTKEITTQLIYIMDDLNLMTEKLNGNTIDRTSYTRYVQKLMNELQLIQSMNHEKIVTLGIDIESMFKSISNAISVAIREPMHRQKSTAFQNSATSEYLRVSSGRSQSTSS